jgi:hypothetical protein
MPPEPQKPKSGGSAEVAPKDKSDYRILKDGGFSNMNQFMQSYGLKMHNDDDIQEAKGIIEGFRQVDQANYEARQQEKRQGK